MRVGSALKLGSELKLERVLKAKGLELGMVVV